MLTFNDMAHSVGLYDIDPARDGLRLRRGLQLQVDLLSYACGVLYVRRESLGELQYAASPNRGLNLKDPIDDVLEVPDSAVVRLQSGPWCWPLVHTWAFALDWLSEIGLEAIWDRTVMLTGRLKHALSEIPGVTLFTPMSPDLSAALVTFHLDGLGQRRPRGPTEAPLEHRNQVGPHDLVPHPGNAPAYPPTPSAPSVAFFLKEEEIDLLAVAVSELASERAWSRVVAEGVPVPRPTVGAPGVFAIHSASLLRDRSQWHLLCRRGLSRRTPLTPTPGTLSQRRCVNLTAARAVRAWRLIPKGVAATPAFQAQRRKVTFVNLAIVADTADDIRGYGT